MARGFELIIQIFDQTKAKADTIRKRRLLAFYDLQYHKLYNAYIKCCLLEKLTNSILNKVHFVDKNYSKFVILRNN